MKVSLTWLKEFLSFDLSDDKLADVLTLAGLEVEGIEKIKDDTIFEISLTPNLGHCMSMLGISREIGALLDLPITIHNLPVTEDGNPIEDLVKIEVEDPKNCPRYTARVIEGIKVGPSPQWLVEKLESVGIRNINNIVDATNLAMIGLGQPMHAFDLDKIEGNKVIIASNTSYSEILTLDNKHRDLPKDALLICDTKSPIAIGGVMGGEDSAVTESTKRILIESAYFLPSTVRKTSKFLGLRTDSSIRFEKEIDPNGVPIALDNATALIQKIAGGKVAKGMIDKTACVFEPKEITCRKERVNEILGTQLSLSEIVSFFKRLHFEVLKEEENVITLRIPTYRNDLQNEIDLIEEIARIYGYNNIPLRPEKYSTSTMPHAPIFLFEKLARSKLLAEGLQEWITCDLISPQLAHLTHEKKETLISVLKPASVDQSVLRPTLLSSMLFSVKNNFDHGCHDLYSFEIGRIHFKEKQGVKEESCAGIVLCGKSIPYHHDPKSREYDFFDIKGVAQNLMEGLEIEQATFEVSHHPNFHPKRQARIKVGTKVVGILGEIHPALLKKIDIDKKICFAELNLHVLYTSNKRNKIFSGLSLYPASLRDFTITVSDSTQIDALIMTIESIHSPFLEKITLLDLYKSKQIGKDKKNVTFRFVYRDPKKTIAMETVEKEHTKITEAVTNKFQQ